MDIKLTELADGAVVEQFNLEMAKVLNNLADPNTDHAKQRSLTIKLTFVADEDRELSRVSVETKSTLAPARGVSTRIIMDRDRSGKVVGAELKSGMKDQYMMDDDGDVADDKGKKVVGFNKVREGK